MQLALNAKTQEQVAIKFLERGGGASQRVIARELLNHRECALHPNIVQLKASSQTHVACTQSLRSPASSEMCSTVLNWRRSRRCCFRRCACNQQAQADWSLLALLQEVFLKIVPYETSPTFSQIRCSACCRRCS